MKRIISIIASAAQVFALSTAMLFAPTLSAPAAAQPCQWNYSFVANVATATYCGQVNSGVGPNNVSTVASLAQLPVTQSGAIYTVQGYRTPGDGGGGSFLSVSGASAGDNCVNFPGNTSVHWQRQLNGQNLTVEMCGAYNNGTNGTITRQAFQDAANYIAGSGTPNGEVDFKGASYLFDTTPVNLCASFFCPTFVGGGERVTKVTYPSISASNQAFLLATTPGARAFGGITGFYIDGNANTVGVQLNGASGTTVSLTMTSNVGYGVVLCNCGAGQFTEINNITVNSDGLGPTQQAILMEATTGNTSFAGNRFKAYISLSGGARTKPIIQDTYASGQLYNATLDLNVHNLNGGTNVTLIGNSSSNAMYFTESTLQLEGINASPFTLVSGTNVYFGGTIYGLGVDRCTGVIYGANFIVANNVTIAGSAVNTAGGAYQYCLKNTFGGPGTVLLNASQLVQTSRTLSVTVSNADNSYNYSTTVTYTQNTGGPGTCVLAFTPVWVATVDTHSYGAPAVGCVTGYFAISNAAFPAGSYTVNYDEYAQ